MNRCVLVLIEYAIQRIHLAGRDITTYLQKILDDRGYSFTTNAEIEIVKDIKEKLAFVAQDYDAEFAAAASSSELDQQFTLPDKSMITVKGTTRMQIPELIFKPDLNGKSCMSVQALANQSV